MCNDKLAALQARWADIADLTHAADVLEWDQFVNMPPGGARARGEQLGTLRRMAHERLTDPRAGEELAAAEAGSPPAGVRTWLRAARREYERAARIPSALVAATSRAATEGYAAWVEAREHNDFSRFAPALARLLDLARERADAVGHNGERYDGLLAEHEPEMRTERLRTIFGEIRRTLLPLIEAIGARPQPSRAPFRRRLAESGQLRAGEAAITAFGYDWRRGRQDRSVHPFSTAFGPGDARITTRLHPDDFAVGFYATLHEAGHALYEQGLPEAWARGPLGRAASTAVHESQSRLWENMVGRSLPFWEHFTPILRQCLPGAFDSASPGDLFLASNVVEPSLIRVEADELTYNLHVALRFELELALLHGDLPVADLPGAWNDAMLATFGIRPGDDLHGVLQDVHWSQGGFAYFPSYTLGNVLAAQWMDSAHRTLGDLDALFRRGEFGPLLMFLRTEIHARGAGPTPDELAEAVSGQMTHPGPYLRYLRAKFSAIYALS